MPVNFTKEFVLFLMEQNEKQSAQIAALTATVEKLTETIKELEEKLNKNSRNSSKPPSSDGLKKPNRNTSLREKGNRKQGAQPGHPGTRMVITGKPDHIEELVPAPCRNCPDWKKCRGTACISEKRYRVDIEIHQTLEEYDCLNVVCPKNNAVLRGEFPENIKGEIQYGTNISAFIVALNTIGAVSAKRIQEIAGSLFDLPVSTGTVCRMLSRCAAKASAAVEEIRQKVAALDVAHFDETGTRVDGRTQWVHVACSPEYTYLFSGRRGKEGMDEMGVLPHFSGVAVHDCWASYWKFPVEHSICLAHLLRELNGIIENHGEQMWPVEFKKFLLKMKKLREKAVSEGKEELSRYHLQKISRQYDEIIKTAHKENPQPEKEPGRKGRRKKGRVPALVERLEKYKGEVCRFIKDFRVAFDNNQAERDLRMIKTKTKVSGCFRTEEGIRNYLTVMSYVGTAKKHGKNAYEAIKSIFENNCGFVFE